MHAEIIATGTELLLGETLDTNSSYLGSKLPALGLEVKRVTLVGDNLDEMAHVLDQAWHRSPFTFTIGGLGPTQDDVTREAIAQVLGEPITTNDALLADLKKLFFRRRTTMPSHNVKQAGLIPSAIGLPNSLGTAPGWWAVRDGRTIIALPGPPRELQVMWEQQVVHRIRERVTDQVILTRTLKTIGLSEALVDEMASPVLGTENPYLGTYAKPDGIHLRIIASGPSTEAAQFLVAPLETRLREIFADNIWGVDEQTPQECIGDLLSHRGLTLATMESCTGGFLASSITDVPGSSAYFKGGVVTYTNDLKVLSGVDSDLIKKHGAVSHETALAMAVAVRSNYNTDLGIGITGVTGPSSLEGVEPGTVFIGVAAEGQQQSDQYRYPAGNRSLVKNRAAVSALLALRQLVEDLKAS